MGDDEATADERRRALEPYRLDDALLDRAAPGAIALHCLPAHPGEEITAEVLYGERQRIWDQAENRRHAQKALLEWLVLGRQPCIERAGALKARIEVASACRRGSGRPIPGKRDETRGWSSIRVLDPREACRRCSTTPSGADA